MGNGGRRAGTATVNSAIGRLRNRRGGGATLAARARGNVARNPGAAAPGRARRRLAARGRPRQR